MIYKYLGINFAIASISLCAIAGGIKLLKTAYINYLKRKYERLLIDSLNKLQIATLEEILAHAKLPGNDLVMEMFNKLKYGNFIYDTRKNNNILYVSQRKRNEQYDANCRGLLRAIETLGMADYEELLNESNLFYEYFVEEDLVELCNKRKILKEIITKEDGTKETLYKSSNIYNKNKNFSNYTCEEIVLD